MRAYNCHIVRIKHFRATAQMFFVGFFCPEISCISLSCKTNQPGLFFAVCAHHSLNILSSELKICFMVRRCV